MTSQPYQPTPPPLCRATHVAPLNASPTKLWTAMSVRGRHCEVSRWLFKVTPALLLVYMNERRQECWGRRTGGCGQSHKPRSYLTTTDSRTLVPVPYVPCHEVSTFKSSYISPSSTEQSIQLKTHEECSSVFLLSTIWATGFLQGEENPQTKQRHVAIISLRCSYHICQNYIGPVLNCFCLSKIDKLSC